MKEGLDKDWQGEGGNEKREGERGGVKETKEKEEEKIREGERRYYAYLSLFSFSAVAPSTIRHMYSVHLARKNGCLSFVPW